MSVDDNDSGLAHLVCTRPDFWNITETMKMRFTTINRDHMIGVFCVALGVVVLNLTRNFPAGQGYVHLTGPAFFPNVLAVILIVAGAAELISGFVNRKTLTPITFDAARRVLQNPTANTILLTIVLMIFYTLFMKTIGFFTSSFVLLFLLMWRLGAGKLRALFSTFAVLLILYLVFGRIFFVNLPTGVLI